MQNGLPDAPHQYTSMLKYLPTLEVCKQLKWVPHTQIPVAPEVAAVDLCVGQGNHMTVFRAGQVLPSNYAQGNTHVPRSPMRFAVRKAASEGDA